MTAELASPIRPPARSRSARAAGPSTATHVQLEAFDGPLALLLSLIEARQLDVLTVPLGALADAYLDALATLETTGSATSARSSSIASQLILIKSRAIAAAPRRGGAAAALRGRRAGPGGGAAGAAAPLPGAPRRRPAAARRGTPPGRPLPARAVSAAAAGQAGARPSEGPPLDPRDLLPCARRPGTDAPPAAPPPETVARTITLTERRRSSGRRSPRGDRGAPGAAADVRDRVVVAVTFLAMLEL